MDKTSLLSKYKPMGKPKKGGQKIVYKVQAPSGEVYALKIISDSGDPRVLQEIEIVKHLSLHSVPAILETGTVRDDAIDEEMLYIVEQYIDGVSLRDWLLAGNKADLAMACKLVETLLDIEVQLETKGILHRDINPNNIILGNNGYIYLIDFGLAKQLGGTSLTQTAAAHGPFTPGYAPHEQFANIKYAQDVRTDLFQIGVTIYECCTGKNPFVMPHDTLLQIMSRTMTVVPPNLSLPGDSKEQFSMFVNMLMAKNQSQRPDSATDAMRYFKAIRQTLITGGN